MFIVNIKTGPIQVSEKYILFHIYFVNVIVTLDVKRGRLYLLILSL